MHTPKFKTKAGLLTPYALSCGYIEQFEKDQVRVTLFNEGGVYHVRKHDDKNHKRLFWYSFDTIGKARKIYLETVRNMRKDM